MKPKNTPAKNPSATPPAPGLASQARERIAAVADAAETLSRDAQEKIERIAVAGRHRLQEATAKASHAAEQLASKVTNAAQEAAQQVVDGAAEAVTAAKHRRQERAADAQAAVRARK